MNEARDPKIDEIKFSFHVYANQHEKIQAWIEEQNVKAIEIQKKKVKKTDSFYGIYQMCWKMGYPYCGTIGGELTYEFTPNSIGESLVVKNEMTGEQLDVTDYDLW